MKNNKQKMNDPSQLNIPLPPIEIERLRSDLIRKIEQFQEFESQIEDYKSKKKVIVELQDKCWREIQDIAAELRRQGLIRDVDLDPSNLPAVRSDMEN